MSPPNRPASSRARLSLLAFITTLVVLLALSLAADAAAPVVEAQTEAAAEDPPRFVRPEEGEIWRLYLAVLGRRPEPGGFEYWTALRVEGIPLSVVVDSFLASREYETRFGTTTDIDFLQLVYRNVLGRAGDPGGVDYWLDVLDGGYPRRDLVVFFAESNEHRAITGTALSPLPPYAPLVRPVAEGDLGASWRPGCPVGPDGLRVVELDYVDPTGTHRRGALVVNDDVVDDVVAIFGELYTARFPLVAMTPVARFGGDDDASMAAGNTSAFNCRPVTGGTRWSRHAYGRAIDINPIQNPYVAGSTVLPPAGVDHLDRTRFDPAMIRPGDVVTEAFGARGWVWGGRFTSLADYQHFER